MNYFVPPVDADAGVQPSSADAEEASSDDVSEKTDGNETETSEEQLKKKPKKEKVGFRDRKVIDTLFSPSFVFCLRINVRIQNRDVFFLEI